MKKVYHWEVVPMDESDPYYVATESDSVVAAARQFEESWGSHISIFSLRKTSTTVHHETDVDWQQLKNEYQEEIFA